MTPAQLYQIWLVAEQHFARTTLVLLLVAIGTTYVVRNHKKIVAFAVTTGKYLNYMAVSKEYQGKGYGSLLLESAVPRISRLRVDPANEKAIGFYKKFGFRVLNESNWITGKRLVMERS